MNKIYFFDTGVRNAIIENFSPVHLRNDVGALWENFLISERLKKSEYDGLYANRYFWRTHSGAELDYVEERNGKLIGYEFKWKSKSSDIEYQNPTRLEIQKLLEVGQVFI